MSEVENKLLKYLGPHLNLSSHLLELSWKKRFIQLKWIVRLTVKSQKHTSYHKIH